MPRKQQNKDQTNDTPKTIEQRTHEYRMRNLEKASFKESRNWAFTDFSLKDFTEIYKEYKDIIRYICWGKEHCPTTNKEHHQGWIQLTNKKSLLSVKRLLGCPGIHLEACQGTERQNDTYCKKEGNFKEYGKFITQGHRSDLEHVKQIIEQGGSIKEVIDTNFDLYCRYRNGIKDLKAIVDEEHSREFRKVDVEVIEGSTGIGKTRIAMEHITSGNVYKTDAPKKFKWWNGYTGQKILVIDEFSCQVPITEMLTLLDGYQYQLDIKGSYTYARWDKVYITTNVPILEWYPHSRKMHRLALMRRISKYTKVLDTGNTETVSSTELMKQMKEQPDTYNEHLTL